MYSSNGSVDRWQTAIYRSPTPDRSSSGPVYHVYSHYGCHSRYIDHCGMCKYLLQPNTYLHPNPQSLVAATKRMTLPRIKRHLESTPIKPVRHRIDTNNDLYLLPKLAGSPEECRKAEDAAIINICLKDKSIDRIVLIDADQEINPEYDDVRYVRLYDVEQR